MTSVIYKLLSLLFFLVASNIVLGQDDEFEPLSEEFIIQGEINDSVPVNLCSNCTKCTEEGTSFALPFKEFPFILVVILLFVLLVFRNNKKKILFWTLGLLLFAGIIFKVAQSSMHDTNTLNRAETVISEDKGVSKSKSLQEVDEYDDSEFETVSEDEEFLEFEEFSEVGEFETFEDKAIHTKASGLTKGMNRNLLRTGLALLATLLAGMVFRFFKSIVFRYVFLLSSLVYLGFISGGCPCMISSFQNLILFLLGEGVVWVNLVWILGLIPLTYFFGKIWCGWVCHLGALQEFIYTNKNANQVLNPSVQKAFKIIRILALITLVIQIVVTRTNLFIKIDPFKVAFNLFSSNITGYVLLGMLLISSLFIYRPFCRSFCPVGLMLGWISRIPGAYKLSVNKDCKSCNRCFKSCSYGAVSNSNKSYVINEECIQCGDCVTVCSFKAISK